MKNYLSKEVYEIKRQEIYNHSATTEEIYMFLTSLFCMFKSYFEANMWREQKKVAEACKDVIDLIITDDFFMQSRMDNKIIEVILDIACFVYDQKHMYSDKKKVLRYFMAYDNLTEQDRKRIYQGLNSLEPE